MIFCITLCLITLIQINYSVRPYVFVNTPMIWENANLHCQGIFGTELATISDLFSNNLANDACPENGCWIGFNDIVTDGTFEWTEGTPVTFENFAPGEPNNFGGNEDCVEIRGNTATGTWNDESCTSLRSFLCNAPSTILFEEIEQSLQFTEFRTFDGTGNNLLNPFGIHNGPIIRTTPTGFTDGSSARARPNGRSARVISNIVTDSPEAETIPSEVGLSNLAWVFGQFMDHELVEQTASVEDIAETRIDETEICIPIPFNDPQFVDPNEECITIIDNAEFNESDPIQRQINIVTAFIDGSIIYGSEPDRIFYLRNFDGTGTMNTSINANNDINLPFNTVGIANSGGANRTDLFVNGEVRVNENIALTSMHTIWTRNHNYLAKQISMANPFLTGDEIFEHARAVNIALLQKITYTEWLPALFGPNNFDVFIDPAAPYDATCDASIAAHFSFVAFRVGHTFISDGLAMQDSFCTGTDSISLLNAFTQPGLIANGVRVIDRLLMGLSCTDARKIDPFIIPTLRNLLQFGVNGDTSPMDLMAINIERGRDDGIADWLTLRQHFGLQTPTSFDDLSINSILLDLDVKNRLQTAYNGDINEVDPIVGAFAESHIPGGAFGALIANEWKEQFQRLVTCDRFWYTRYLSDGLLKYVESTTMKNIIQSNSSPRLEFLPNHQFVFNAPGKGLNADITFIPILNIGAGGLCLAVPFNDVTNNNPIILQTCSGADAERWYYNIKSKEIVHSSGKCLAVRMSDFDNRIEEGTVVIFDCTGTANQNWILEENDTNNHIRNFLGMCLQVDMDQIFVNFGSVNVATCIFPGVINQRWFYTGNQLPY